MQSDDTKTDANVRRRYAPANMCLYCGTTDGKLTDEHVVPYAIGGTVVIPKASCSSCQTAVGKGEVMLARRTWLLRRAAHDFPSRSKLKGTSGYPTRLPFRVKHGGKKWTLRLPIEEAPITILFPRMRLPPWAEQVAPADWPDGTSFKLHHVGGDVLHQDRTERLRRMIPKGASASFDTDPVRLHLFFSVLYKVSLCAMWVSSPQFFNSARADEIRQKGLFPKTGDRPDFEIDEYADLFSRPTDVIDGRFGFRVRVFECQESSGAMSVYVGMVLLGGDPPIEHLCRIGPLSDMSWTPVVIDSQIGIHG